MTNQICLGYGHLFLRMTTLASEGGVGDEEWERRFVIPPALLLCFRFSEQIYGLAVGSCECGEDSQIRSFVIFFPTWDLVSRRGIHYNLIDHQTPEKIN